MKLVFDLTDIEEKLTLHLRGEGLEVSNLRWEGVNAPLELIMDFKSIPPTTTSFNGPNYRGARIEESAQDEGGTITAPEGTDRSSSPRENTSRRRKQRKPVNDGSDVLTAVLRESNAISMHHPVTNTPVVRPLAMNESLEYPE